MRFMDNVRMGVIGVGGMGIHHAGYMKSVDPGYEAVSPRW